MLRLKRKEPSEPSSSRSQTVMAELEMLEWLSSVSYKPGSIIYAPMFSYNDEYYVNVYIPVTERNTHCSCYLASDCVYQPSTIKQAAVPQEYFYELFFATLREAEVHECQEWFCVDGKVKYDPHAANQQ